ncbi:MAG TPA: ATP-binding protein [Kiritimatiellia bacterium]|nr:ATP-binding protein [Kiritimatiellia bacterium]
MIILIAEDDDNSRVLQQTILESNGHTVISTSNGKEALMTLATQKPDLIISDIMMPEVDGYAFCRSVKSDPELARIPFVFYSATFTSSSDQQLASELGCSLFLIKPMDPDALMAAINDVMASTHSQEPPVVKPIDRDAMDIKYASAISRKLDKKVKELKQAHIELSITQGRLQQIKESYRLAQKIAQIGCWDYNAKTGEYWWSEELYTMLGVPQGRKPSRDLLLEHIAPADRDRYMRALNMAEEKSIAFHMDHQMVSDSGHLLMVRSETEISAFDPATGRPARLVCVIQDITRQRAVEEEKSQLELNLRQGQKMQALGSLASSIAHDFNNILTTIITNAELLSISATSLGKSEQQQLDDIVDACKRATGLVAQIRTFSRQEKQNKEPTSLAELINETIRLLRNTLPANIRIQCHMEPKCPRVLANPTQLHQIIMNLLVNAFQAMQPNGGVVDIRLESVQVAAWDDMARRGLKAGSYLLLKVSDTGVGMDEFVQNRIFEPYFTTKEHHEGTGLGLSVVHGIVLEHNGQITVNSKPGEGTSFMIYLPVYTSKNHADPHTGSPSHARVGA